MKVEEVSCMCSGKFKVADHRGERTVSLSLKEQETLGQQGVNEKEKRQGHNGFES